MLLNMMKKKEDCNPPYNLPKGNKPASVPVN